MIEVRIYKRWLAGVVVGICAAVAIWAPDPDRYQRSWVSLHDFLHVPGFAFIMGALLIGFDGPREESRARRFGRLLGMCVVAAAIGGGVELAQGAMGGSADPWDVLRDGGGIVVAALWSVAQWREQRALARWLLRCVSLAMAVGFFVPTFDTIADEMRARRQFPVLADFGARSELSRFTWSDSSSAVLDQADSMDSSRKALHLFLLPGKYPGLSFEFFPRDWRGWPNLVLVCTNPADAPLLLTIRISDLAHNQEYSDRYNQSFTLVPGTNEIRIPLADVESAPQTRKLDLGHVASVVAFVYELREPRELFIQQLRLSQ
jgi:hypothetical protein